MRSTSPISTSEDELFVPAYRPLTAGAWTLDLIGGALLPGYWSGVRLVRDVPALRRGGETWMSLSPLELESAAIGIRAARGHVLIHGLGMGWSMCAVAARDAVSAVTVVERDADVLALHRELDLLSQLQECDRAKVRIVEGDAFEYRPQVPVDLLFPDIWLPLVGGDRFEEVRRMQGHAGAAMVYFWGQELELARHAVAAGRGLDAEGISATAAESGLPLAGLDLPGYAELVAGVSERWMRGRWL